MDGDYECLVLHKHPQLIDQCCDLINSEWPRSHMARRNLECSCDNLPTCLVLVQRNNVVPRVVGHGKISRIPSIEHGAFIESVVIDKNMRGKGLGRILMRHTENYMKSIGLKEAYLSTYDQQGFYSRLGYEFCERVSIYGSAITFPPLVINQQVAKEDNHKTFMGIQISPINTNAPPPPPLPPSLHISKVPNFSSNNVPHTNIANGQPKKDFMKKTLT
ncbi:N-alpha-acetyltransferase 80 isoform X2 [Neocloeon triangulifer]|uniref:N-alpha-acetyltransferase 80 isoform X2 n=1 Tax=Neocloeon triangulifer TaxID=2078957 RepID=UPI00286EC462|nr:N-alpha-acetyltransferase 80 isoform X2 [Neocloeon triangulifer]